MKQIPLVTLLLLIAIVGCGQNQSSEVVLSTKVDSVSYSIGLDIGRSFRKQEIEIVPQQLLSGIVHGIADTSILTDDEVQAIMFSFQTEMRAKQQNKTKLIGEKNKTEAEAFFAENKTKPGVISLPSGMQYKILESGSGKSPKLSSTVEAHYRGRLLDGTEFDSSYKRGKPFTTKLTGVIRGWTEILQLMKEGDKWEVYIPSELAYGPRGGGQLIGPNAALIFEMELISVK